MKKISISCQNGISAAFLKFTFICKRMNIFKQNLDSIWQKATCRRPCTFYLAILTEIGYLAYSIQGSIFFWDTLYSKTSIARTRIARIPDRSNTLAVYIQFLCHFELILLLWGLFLQARIARSANLIRTSGDSDL